MRQFSITRRRKNVVDILVDIDPAKDVPIEQWIYKASTSINGPFTEIVRMGNGGLRSKTVKDYSYDSGFRGKVRFIWNPVDYSYDDSKPIYLKLSTKDMGTATEVDYDTIHVITTYNSSAHPPVHIAGDAVSAGSIDDSMEIALPKNCHQFIFENLGGANLFVALDESGPEYKLKPGTILELFDTTSSLFLVRGEGAGVEFSAVCTIQNATDIA